MKTPNLFSREDVLRANDALRRQSQSGSASSLGHTSKLAPSVRLTSEEINRAYSVARKALSAV